MKYIPVSIEVWRQLLHLRTKQGFKHYSKTIEWLLEQVSSIDINNKTRVESKTMSLPDKKTLQPSEIECSGCNHVIKFMWDGISSGSVICPKCKVTTRW